MSVKAKMTAIADEIRELSGTSGAMGLDAMATNLGDANTEVSGQADLIAQIASALEGKASGGNIELPELTNPASQEEVFLDKEFIDKDGKAKTGTFTIENELTEQDSLIAQIQSVVDNLPEAGGSGSGVPEFSTVTFRLADVNLSDHYNFLGHWEFCFITANYINETYTQSSLILFSNNEDNKMDKSEIIITVPTNSTIFLDFEAAGNHYISAISSNNHNELYDMEQYQSTGFNYSVYSAGCRFQTGSGAYWFNIPIFGDTEVIIEEYD